MVEKDKNLPGAQAKAAELRQKIEDAVRKKYREELAASEDEDTVDGAPDNEKGPRVRALEEKIKREVDDELAGK